MSKSAIAPPVRAAPVLAALPMRERTPAEARAATETSAPTARTPREAGSQFAALLDARPADASPATAPVAAHNAAPIAARTALLETPCAPMQPLRPAPPERGRPTDRAEAAPRAAAPAMPGPGPTAGTSAWQHEGPRAPPRVARATSAADDIERLIDELAEFVLRQPGARAQSWSVTLWLRASVLRDTCLTMNGEPGRIAISFATDNAASLCRLRAGHEALQARLRERIRVPTLDVSIDATRPEESHA